MSRLLGILPRDVQADRANAALEVAQAASSIVVLKGAGTLVCDGKRMYQNRTGNPGMATGGTGDVLTGMIAAWLAQLLDAEAACKLAVYLHGMAGDLAEADEGEVAMTAADVAGHLGDAMMELTARRKIVERNGSH
jgi:NAD(P)H-hydrate epimerase